MLQTFSDKFGEVRANKPTGDLGEDYFFKMCQDLGLDVTKETESLDWDFNVNGKRVDVKVLRNNFGPRDGFLLNVRANQINPHIDVFAFFYFNLQTGEFSFAGALPKDEFLARSTLKRAGEMEKTGFVYHCDTYTIADNSLMPIEIVVGKRLNYATTCHQSGGTFADYATTLPPHATTFRGENLGKN